MLPVLGLVFTIYLAGIGYLDFGQVSIIGSILCLLGFFLTGTISHRELERVRYTVTTNVATQKIPEATENEIDMFIAEKRTERPPELPPLSMNEEEDLSLPAVLGANGIYGIVIGLGISDALLKYVEKITGTADKPGTIGNFFANNTAINQTMGYFTNITNYTLIPFSIISISLLNLPETFRLAGFLFTIIPFIHGTILMFSKKWYLDTKSNPHYFVALLFFIVVFIITIMYYFIAVNILEPAFFIFSLWLVMAFNSGWLVVYSKIIKWKLKKQYLVRREWVLLNLNTLAFLSVFLFASPNLLSIKHIVGDDILLNFLIMVILFARVLTDYIIFWQEYYQPAIELRRNSS